MSTLFINYKEQFTNIHEEIERLGKFLDGDVIMQSNFEFHNLLGFDMPNYSILYDKVLIKEYNNGSFHDLENGFKDNYHFKAFISKFSEIDIFYCHYDSQAFFRLYKAFKLIGDIKEIPLFVQSTYSPVRNKIRFYDFISQDEEFHRVKREYFFNYFFESHVNKNLGFKHSLTDFLFVKIIDDLFQRLHNVPYYMFSNKNCFNFEYIQSVYDNKLLNNYEENNKVFVRKGVNFDKEHNKNIQISKMIGDIDPEEIFLSNVLIGKDVKLVIDNLFKAKIC